MNGAVIPHGCSSLTLRSIMLATHDELCSLLQWLLTGPAAFVPIRLLTRGGILNEWLLLLNAAFMLRGCFVVY